MSANHKAIWRRYLPLACVLLVAGGAGAGIVWAIKGFLNAPAPSPKQIVQQVRLIRPPPPPPELEEPPPPEVEEEVDIPEPEQLPEPAPADLPPAGEMLGLDADGVAGADGFGLLARRGGRDLLAGGGDRYAWYAGILQQDILDFLTDDEAFRKRRYDISLSLWLSNDGAVEKIDVIKGSGDREFDTNLRTALAQMSVVSDAPPNDLPQPVRIRIVSRL
jgi:protein TonB